MTHDDLGTQRFAGAADWSRFPVACAPRKTVSRAN